jgi:hypothetical protein
MLIELVVYTSIKMKNIYALYSHSAVICMTQRSNAPNNEQFRNDSSWNLSVPGSHRTGRWWLQMI